MTIYVGNLAYSATIEGLKDLFSQYGEVIKVIIPTDKDTGRSRGFAFVQMQSEDEEDSAVNMIEQSSGLEYLDRMLKVNKAKPKPEGGSEGGDRRSPRGGPRSSSRSGSGFGGERSSRPFGERRSSSSSSSFGSGERRQRRNSYDN